MEKISLHIPCLVDMFLPDTGKSAVHLLNRLGIPFVYHDNQTCCGQPAYSAGFLPEARKVARHFIEVFGEDEAVISLSGSCVEMIKMHFPELLAEDPSYYTRALELSQCTYELTQYLVEVAGLEDVGGRFEGTVAYHESCKLNLGLGISEQPKKLIRSLTGTELVHLSNADVCCGFGGEFSHKYPDISEPLVADKVKNFLESGADVLTMAEPGCFLNISGYISRHHPEKKVVHIVDLLAGEIR
jgi:L-lactate dehydrogenase complex protein LldE